MWLEVDSQGIFSHSGKGCSFYGWGQGNTTCLSDPSGGHVHVSLSLFAVFTVALKISSVSTSYGIIVHATSS